MTLCLRHLRRPMVTVALLSLSMAAIAPACGGEPEAGPNPCGIEEQEPNDRPAAATPIALGAETVGCLGSETDVDYLALTAPADQTGGYLQIAVGDTGGAAPTLVIYDATGTGELGRFGTPAAGGGPSFFVAVAPGQRYRLMIENGGALPGPATYKLMTIYTPVADTFEPNDSREAAAPITVGTPVSAFIFAGQEGAEIDPATYDDYYRFSTGAGKVTVTLENLPPNLAARLFLYRPDGSEVARVSSGQKGGALTLATPMPVEAGDHVVSVALWTATVPATLGEGTTVPPQMTQPYKLTVVQP